MGRGKSRSWLCPTELDRSRVVDASPRVRTIRLVGTGSVGLALLAAGPWWLPPGKGLLAARVHGCVRR